MSTVISVENVSKSYRLGSIGGATLKEDFARWWAKRRGKPDPLLKVGDEHGARLMGEEFWALRDVSFQVQQGEVLGVIGRNGAGKSTLLKILSQVTSPTSGEIKIKGRIASLLEVGTGFHPELTGRENVFLNGAILGMTKAEIRKKFDEIVAFSGIEEFIDTPVKRYSSGMYVRLAFAVAAHLEPEILIVDEVLAVGDAEFQKKCMGKMQDVAQGEKRTVLFVSHNVSAVRQLCTRGILLQNGTLTLDASINQTLESYLSDSLVSVEGSFDLSSHPARSSNHQAVIRRVQLLTAAEVPTDTIYSDEAMLIELTLRPGKPIREPRVAVAIEDAYGERITTLASYFEGHSLPDINDECRVRCRLPQARLGSGRYLLSVSIGDKYTGLLDSVDGAACFNIAWKESFAQGEPYLPVYGPVLTRSEWSSLQPEGL